MMYLSNQKSAHQQDYWDAYNLASYDEIYAESASIVQNPVVDYL